MRHTMFKQFRRQAGRAGTAAIAALAATAWIAPALAQPAPAPAAPPPASQQAPAGPMGGPMGGPGGGPMGRHMGGHMGGGHMGDHGGGHHAEHRHGHRGPFGGLIFPREDKALTTAEVQKIAEAFLLWQGERNWRITDVKEAANNTVEFAVTTAEGGVVARFSMDRKTGRPRRIA